jgi:hypothetical protein
VEESARRADRPHPQREHQDEDAASYRHSS